MASISLDAAAQDRDQLWAEAVALYRDGVPWWLTDAAEILAAQVEQGARYAEDAWADQIEDFVKDKDAVTTAEILTYLGKPLEQWTQLDQKRVVSCLKVQGRWKRMQRRKGERRCWVYGRI